MGGCSSCESTSVATAKLVLHDGSLQEFPYPVKVSRVLQKNPDCFICDSDDMDFDVVLSAVGHDEELWPGHLYFALPLSRLKLRLQAEDMAALAVKASSALRKSSSGNCKGTCGCRRSTLELPRENGRRKAASGGESGPQRRRPGDAGRKQKYMASLTAIPE